MDMDRKRRHLEGLLLIHLERLSNLEEQAARFGLPVASTTNESKSLEEEVRIINETLNLLIPPQTWHEQLWKIVTSAISSRQWTRAAGLVKKTLETLETDPSEEEDRETSLEEAKSRRFEADYEDVRKLRNSGNALALLSALDSLEHKYPHFTDPEGLRQWAEDEQNQKSTGPSGRGVSMPMQSTKDVSGHERKTHSGHIFISYASKDRAVAQKYAEALEAQGWQVWWDTRILGGQHFDQVIEQAIQNAGCAIVLWSQTSVKSGWVKDEAAEARDRQILVPVLIEDIRIPLGYRHIQTINLTQWDGTVDFPQFRRLLNSIAALVDIKPHSDLVISTEIVEESRIRLIKSAMDFREWKVVLPHVSYPLELSWASWDIELRVGGKTITKNINRMFSSNENADLVLSTKPYDLITAESIEFQLDDVTIYKGYMEIEQYLGPFYHPVLKTVKIWIDGKQVYTEEAEDNKSL